MENQSKHQVAYSTFSIRCKLLWEILFYNFKPFTYKTVFADLTSWQVEGKKDIKKLLKKIINHEIVIQNQDTSEDCKFEHATETAEVMLTEIFLPLIITCRIYVNPFVLKQWAVITVLSTCPPKESKGFPLSVLTQF